MEHYKAMEMYELLLCTSLWVNFTNIMLSKRKLQYDAMQSQNL